MPPPPPQQHRRASTTPHQWRTVRRKSELQMMIIGYPLPERARRRRHNSTLLCVLWGDGETGGRLCGGEGRRGGRLIDETANRILHRHIASDPTALARENRRSNIVVSVCECVLVFTRSDLVSRHVGASSRFCERDRCSRRSLIIYSVAVRNL